MAQPLAQREQEFTSDRLLGAVIDAMHIERMPGLRRMRVLSIIATTEGGPSQVEKPVKLFACSKNLLADCLALAGKGSDMRILLVEDDPLVASGIVAGLKLHGLTIDHVGTASRADTALSTSHFDICILDLGLPDEDGMALLRRWRDQGRDIPVLILTARDALNHRVAGLLGGADDYLVKPFDLDELQARLHVLTRRVAGRSKDCVTHGKLTFCSSSGEVWLDGREITLARRELSLLRALMQNPQRILSTEQLCDSVYGYDKQLESNAIHVHIHHLRRKLGTNIVETARGLGYRLGAAGKVGER